MVNRRQLLKISALGTASFAAPLAYSASKITMAYNTGNPVGSTSPKDLLDNAVNLDLLVNGTDSVNHDRLGRPRTTWYGMEQGHIGDQERRESEFRSERERHTAEFGADQDLRASEFDGDQSGRHAQFNTFMDASGFESPVAYAAGLGLTRITQTVTYLGNEYRAKSADLPLTTTNWAADESKLKLIGDDSLRQSLAGAGGAGMLFSKIDDPAAISRSVEERLRVTTRCFVGANPVGPAPSIIVPSTSALQAHINWAWRQGTRSLLINGGISYGRIEIDLGGKEYVIDAPLIFPGSGGGVSFKNGFITASDSFPLGEVMLRNTATGTTDQVYWDGIYFNGNNRATLLRLDSYIRCRVTGCTFFGNLGAGLYLGTKGFEMMVSQSFFFQTYDGAVVDIPSGCRGVVIESGATDNHFTDCVSRGNEIGVESFAAANTYKSFHCYGTDHRIRDSCWGMAFKGNTANNRINDCQMDSGVRILIENPTRFQLKGSPFATLSGGPVECIVLKAITANHYMRGCSITGQMFDVPAGSDAIKIAADSLSFSQAEFKNNDVSGNVGNAGVIIRSTKFSVKATVVKATSGTINLSEKFLLGQLSKVQATARAMVKAQRVSSVTLTSGGSGYVSPPTVHFSASDGGILATGVALLTKGVVTGVTITNPGRYFIPATVAFTGGGSRGAAGSVVMATDAHLEPVGIAFQDALPNLRWSTDKALVGEVHFHIDTSIDD